MVQWKRPLAIQKESTQSGKAQPSLIFREADLEAGSCKRPDKANAAEMIPKTERETHTIPLTILLVVLKKQQRTQITEEFCRFTGNDAQFFFFFFLIIHITYVENCWL